MVFLAWGGMWSPPQLLPIKQSWHFRARQRRWLPALEVSIWPLSRHCLPSPSPLTSVDPDCGPNRPIVILPGLNGAIQGLRNRPLWRALPPPPLECPWPQPSPVWVGGLAVVRAAGSRGNITEAGLLTEGMEMPHTSRDFRALCPHCAPHPTRGSRASEWPTPEDRAALPPPYIH